MEKRSIACILLASSMLYGCGTSIPECNTAEAKQHITDYYFSQMGVNPEKVALVFDRVTTESLNKDTKSRKCGATITTRLTPALFEQLSMDTEEDDPGRLLERELALSIVGIKAEATANVIFFIKYDEQSKTYFIQYPESDWPKELSLANGFGGLLLND